MSRLAAALIRPNGVHDGDVVVVDNDDKDDVQAAVKQPLPLLMSPSPAKSARDPPRPT